MFEIKNVSKQYGSEFALQNISLTIGRGMNFIIGASGSGKTTLLKILSGMEKAFDGDVLYCGQSVKKMSDNEKSYFYNHIFGFVWQDFHLLEERTVLENIMLPGYLNDSSEQFAVKLMKSLKIHDLSDQKVKFLSGGQKQRVAIARELMKNPLVLIADEPTSALDKKSSQMIMEVLRTLSKKRIVIVVTHDTSLVKEKDNVIELDKGELIHAGNALTGNKTTEIKENLPYTLPFSKAWKNSVVGAKRKTGRFFTAMLSLMIAGVLLLTSASSAIGDRGNAEFEKLLQTYGDGILDIVLADSFTGAAGTAGEDENKPNADVEQDLSGLYEKYQNDERVEFIVPSQAFENIKITSDGQTYTVEKTGNTPVLTKLLSGSFPTDDKFQVIIPLKFAERLGLTPESAIGKEIDFSATIYKWINNQPVEKPVKLQATICGVADNTVTYDYEGKTMKFTVDDSFFFNRAAVEEVRKQAGIENDSVDFIIRAKTPEDMISLKDELNKSGIVPLGQFELVEDMVRLQTQTTELSGGATAVIIALGILAVITVSLMTTILRKKEYAIYKISGYKTAHLLLMNLCDTMLYAISGVLLLLLTAPLLNLITKNLLQFNMLRVDMLFIGACFVLSLSVLYYVVSLFPCFKIDLSKELKSGEK